MRDGDRLEISHLGAQGDGVASHNGQQVFVPGALPGEHWRVGNGDFQQVTTSPNRQTSVCAHFSDCGGCVAQHMDRDLYAKWKVDALTSAFAHRGIDVQPEPLRSVSPGARRRTTLSFLRTGSAVALGYHRSASHEIIEISQCPVLQDRLSSQLSALGALSSVVAREGKEGRMVVTALDQGLDVAVTAPGAKPSQNDRLQLSRLATDMGAVLLTLNGDPIIEAKPPVLTINGARIAPTSSTFLQVAPEAELWIADIIKSATKRTKKAVDLFCGVGTFTFPLAKRCQVTAYDGDSQAVAALSEAINNNQGFKPITPHQRDLFRDPLSVRELRAFDAAVINPPRAGAAEQCERLAQSAIKTLVMVACNPATLSRDARTLVDGGYTLKGLTPIDQFVYSAHLESVAVFERLAASKR